MSTPVADAGERAPVADTLRVGLGAPGRLAAASALGAAALLASMALLATAAWLLARAAGHPSEAALGLAIVAVQFFGLSRGFLRYGERLVGHDAALRGLALVRGRVVGRLERLAPAGLPQFRRGDLLARMVGDVDALQDVPIRVVEPVAVAVAVGALSVGACWAILPGAGLVVLAAVVVAATVVPWLTGTLAERGEARLAAERAELSVAVLDLLDGSAELTAMGTAADQVARVEHHDREVRRLSRRAATTSGVGLGLVTLLTGLACWATLVLGVGAVHGGRLNGVLLGTVAVIPLGLFEALQALPGAGHALAGARRAAGRVLAVCQAEPPVADPPAPRPLPQGPHALALREVTAGYPGADRPAVQGLDLDLPPGRRVALVGSSGAGKSTVAAVLLRFLPLQSGTATLDGRPVDEYDADDVRRVVGLVEQLPHFFNASLADNLRIGRRDADEDELWAALDRVGLSEWARDLPQGLRTEVGQFGARLSGGQRQRLATARALLADFPVLVLDEPTEHLDPAGADRLLLELLEPDPTRTRLLITHRLVGLEGMDEIVVLEGGRVTERGDHRSLVEAGGAYARRWRAERAESQQDRPPDDHQLASGAPSPLIREPIEV